MNVKQQRLTVVLIIAATGCMAAALWLPLLRSRIAFELPSWVPPAIQLRFHEWFDQTARLPIGDYSVWRIVRQLCAGREYLVASVIVLLAAVLPVVNLALCGLLTLHRSVLSVRSQGRLLRAVDSATRWSMGSVFIASLLIVFASAPAFGLTLEVRAGLYWYVAGIALLIVVSELIRQVGQRVTPTAKTGCM